MRLLKKICKILGCILGGIFGVEIILYLMAPIYSFPEPQPFQGDLFLNPYQNLDSAHWRKANFHFHTRAWGGLTSGRHNTHQAFYDTYHQLGYDAPQISNYQSIDHFYQDSAFFVPTYEHGFGIRKKHQMLIGAKKVLWFDYSLFQNLNHKQHILNLLRPKSDIVAIAHPDWEGGYSPEHMKYLSNYDLIEVLDNNWRSVPQWDAALSSGHPAYILSDDDAHDIADPYQIHRCLTYIHSPSLEGKNLVKALRAGQAFGAEIYMLDGETFEQKIIHSKEIPRLNSVRMTGDTLCVSVSQKAFKISFIGQDGKIRKNIYLNDQACYAFKPWDTYIRTEITFIVNYAYPKVGQGTKFYLNPVFRYMGKIPENTLRAAYDPVRTWSFRIIGGSSLIFALMMIWITKRINKLKKPENAV